MTPAELRRFKVNAAGAVYARIRDLAQVASARRPHQLADLYWEAVGKAWNRYDRLSRRSG